MQTGRRTQIGLCAKDEHVFQALGLQLEGAPITVWQFDDEALTLFSHGIRLRLRVAADGSASLTLKVTGQECVSLDARRVPRRGGKREFDVHGDRPARCPSRAA